MAAWLHSVSVTTENSGSASVEVSQITASAGRAIPATISTVRSARCPRHAMYNAMGMDMATSISVSLRYGRAHIVSRRPSGSSGERNRMPKTGIPTNIATTISR